MKESITPKEKALLDFMYEKANDILDYCHRNGVTVPTSIHIHPDYNGGEVIYDYRNVSFSEGYESGRVKRIVSLHYNGYEEKAEYDESLYEDEDYE